MKKAIAIIIAAAAFAAHATPSADNYHSVTNDWYCGNYSNVLEWAQTRLAANTNDVAASYVMVEYDTSFSDFSAMSNSVLRLIRVSDAVADPDFAEIHQKIRPGWIAYLEDFLPAQSESERLVEQQKSYRTGRKMTCDFILELLNNNNLW